MMKASRTFVQPTSNQVPWFVISNGEGGKKLTIVNVSDARQNFTRPCPKQFRWKVCTASMHSWLLMMDPWWLFEKVESCLWNLETQQTFELPPLDVEGDQLFGVWVVVSNSMVLFAGPGFFLIWQLGDKEWTKQDYQLVGDEQHPQIISHLISCTDGAIYAMTNYRKLAVIETQSCGLLSVRLLNCEAPLPETARHVYHLLECFGQVYLVLICFGGNWNGVPAISTVDIFKMDFSEEVVFLKIDSLGDRMFFISADTSTSYSATGLGLKGNCVYIPLQKELYKFDLQDESLSVCLPCPNMLPPSFTPFWFAPKSNEDGPTENKLTTTKVGTKVDFMESRLLSDLPTDILHKIAMHLHLATEYASFRHVSRTIRLSVPPIQLPTQYPLLMFSSRGNSSCSFSDPMNNLTYCFDMPELFAARFRFSKDGWLLMSKGHYSHFFFNPFTKATIGLPDLPPPFAYSLSLDALSFSSAPTSPDCIVIGTRFLTFHNVLISLVQPGDSNWTDLDIEYEDFFLPSRASPVFHDGSFYFLGVKKYMGVFYVRNKTWKILTAPRPCSSIQQNYLAECNGELTSVFVGRGGNYVHTYRFDHRNMIWERLSGLKDQALFVSRTMSTSVKVISECMENKIYFPISWKDDHLSYSLETHRWHFSFAGQCKDDIYNTSEKLYCTWIQPSFQCDVSKG